MDEISQELVALLGSLEKYGRVETIIRLRSLVTLCQELRTDALVELAAGAGEGAPRERNLRAA